MNTAKETLQKCLFRLAGDRFVWNESGRTQYALRVQTRDGLQLNRHPVNNCFNWIPACAGMTNWKHSALVQSFPKCKFAQTGFSLLEVLITMIIILIGLLGIASLQGKAQIAELESYQRAQALILLSDIVDRININRETATCFKITTNTANGTPFIGAAGAGHLGTPTCTAHPDYNALAIATINSLDSLLKGTAETLEGASVGAMIGARACISYDAGTELGPPTKAGTGLYTISVSWQAMADLTTPTDNCANDLYGDETKRRTVSTTMRLADIN